MADAPNPKRAYDSPRRREQAAATRRDILAAAQPLLERQGYSATTMAAIAAAAGVALKTVYAAFETKSGLLRGLWNVLLRGDDEDVPVQDRAWYREALDEPDPARQLQLNARNSRAVKSRIAGVLEVIRHAAPLDPEIEALWSRIQSDFYDNQRAIVESLADKGALRSEPRRGARHGHPLDAQPSRHLAAAGRPARLDARAVRAVVRRHGGRSAARWRRLLRKRFLKSLTHGAPRALPWTS